MSWHAALLGNLVEIRIGGTPSRSVSKYWEKTEGYGKIWLSISDLKNRRVGGSKEKITDDGIRNSSVKLIPKDTVIMSFKLTIGRLAITSCELYTNEAIAGFVIKSDDLISDYLYYALQTAVLDEETDTAVKGATLNKDKLSRISIPLPPLPVQRWIADALASVDDWIEANEQNAEWLDIMRREILEYVFPTGTMELSEVIESIESGVSAEGTNTPASANELGVLKVSVVTQGLFKPAENKVVKGSEVSRLRTRVEAGQILVSRSNTLDLVGEVGMPLEDHPNLYLPDKLWVLRIKSSKNIESKWLMYYLVKVKNSGIVSKLASGSSGSMKNISQKHYLKILVPQVDIKLQREISSALTALQEHIIVQNEYLMAAKLFRQIFLQQVFSGTLYPVGGWAAVVRESTQVATT